MNAISQLAELIDTAALNGTAVPQLTVDNPQLTVADAYAIQAQSIQRRCDRGERLVGVKLGLTSRAKMRQVNVNEVIAGRLTDAMRIADGGSMSLDRSIHARAEPEIAFILKRPLSGVIGLSEASAAIDAVMPAIEIIDSRYQNFKFTQVDVVADNTSASRFVIGAPGTWRGDLSLLGVVMSFNGAPVQIGSLAALLGNPLRTLVEAARMAEQYGFSLQPGDIVMAGAATEAVPLQRGTHVSVEISQLGRTSFEASTT